MRSTLFIFVFLAASESVSGILDNVEERFVASIAKAFKCSRVAVVLRLRGGEKASTVDFGSVMLGYDKDDPASIGETVEAIVDLVESESADMVYFAATAGHMELAHYLAEHTGVFQSRTASIFLPAGDFKDTIDERELGLRLDSKVYFYDLFDNGTGADIEEGYYIKSKVRVRRTVGRWTGGSKVSLDVQFNIWERRADLKGVELVNAVMPLSILTIVDCDSSKPLRVSGYLIDLFALIQERLNFTASHVCPKDREWGSRLGDNGTWSGIVSERLHFMRRPFESFVSDQHARHRTGRCLPRRPDVEQRPRHRRRLFRARHGGTDHGAGAEPRPPLRRQWPQTVAGLRPHLSGEHLVLLSRHRRRHSCRVSRHRVLLRRQQWDDSRRGDGGQRCRGIQTLLAEGIGNKP